MCRLSDSKVFSGVVAASQSASSDQNELNYTPFPIVQTEMIMWGNRVHTVEGFEHTPCRDGVFLQSSLDDGISAGTVISVDDGGICAFFTENSSEWDTPLEQHGFTNVYAPANFHVRLYNANGSGGETTIPLTMRCKHGVRSATLPPALSELQHGICT